MPLPKQSTPIVQEPSPQPQSVHNSPQSPEPLNLPVMNQLQEEQMQSPSFGTDQLGEMEQPSDIMNKEATPENLKEKETPEDVRIRNLQIETVQHDMEIDDLKKQLKDVRQTRELLEEEEKQKESKKKKTEDEKNMRKFMATMRREMKKLVVGETVEEEESDTIDDEGVKEMFEYLKVWEHLKQATADMDEELVIKSAMVENFRKDFEELGKLERVISSRTTSEEFKRNAHSEFEALFGSRKEKHSELKEKYRPVAIKAEQHKELNELISEIKNKKSSETPSSSNNESMVVQADTGSSDDPNIPSRSEPNREPQE